MAKLNASRGAQFPALAEFIFNFDDTMDDVNGVTKTFGSDFNDAGTFEVINMPAGAVIESGDLIVETQGVGPTAYTVAVGTSAGAGDLLGATTLLSADNTIVAFDTVGIDSTVYAGGNIQITIASTVANATAGKFRVRLMYTLDDKSDVNQGN
jgi:hypothetical protein